MESIINLRNPETMIPSDLQFFEEEKKPKETLLSLDDALYKLEKSIKVVD